MDEDIIYEGKLIPKITPPKYLDHELEVIPLENSGYAFILDGLELITLAVPGIDLDFTQDGVELTVTLPVRLKIRE